MISRRHLLAGATALGGASLLPSIAYAKGSVAAAIYPGTWEEAFRAIVAPALEEEGRHRSRASAAVRRRSGGQGQGRARRAAVRLPSCSIPARASPPSRAACSRNSTPRSSPTRPSCQPGWSTNGASASTRRSWASPTIPRRYHAPKGWKDLFSDPWVSRLGITGFQTTFGTVSLIEIAKVFGGSETNIEPALRGAEEGAAQDRRGRPAGRHAGPFPAGPDAT